MSDLAQWFWLIPFFPLIGFFLNGLFGKAWNEGLVHLVGVFFCLIPFVITYALFDTVDFKAGPLEKTFFTWMAIDSFMGDHALHLDFKLYVDQLTVVMLLFITGIGSLIHIYAGGYMKGDDGFHRFFAYLNLFMFSMIMLVMGGNLIVLFLGWEGVGLCSYLLIGFWYKDRENAAAGRKAFIYNRIGDLGFLMGAFFLFVGLGTLDIDQLHLNHSHLSNIAESPLWWLFPSLLGFIIAFTGKSAQIPLYLWLPDAMAGPTPVSALIHAATMVTSGVYLAARLYGFFSIEVIESLGVPFAGPVQAGELLALIGACTALLAALIALTQNDIKKVLAYSTVSQLGYMFLAMGVGAPVAGLFHMFTHAFFKALLFLGAGSVIVAMHHQQDMRLMGGLARKMPITHLTMLIGCLAIAGFPFMSGFVSKDEILWSVWLNQTPLLHTMAVITAGLTAFYMFRLYFLTFWGECRADHHTQEHIHETPLKMTFPLMVLAVGAVFAGVLNWPAALPGGDTVGLHRFEHYLAPSEGHSVFAVPYQEGADATSHHLQLKNLKSQEHLTHLFGDHDLEHAVHHKEIQLMLTSTGIGFFGIFLAWFLYSRKSLVPARREKGLPALKALSYNKFYVDEMIDMFLIRPFVAMAHALYFMVDRVLIEGIVNGIPRLCMAVAQGLTRLQGHGLSAASFLMGVGMLGLMIYVTWHIFKGGVI